MAEKKEFTVEADELAKDPAVTKVEPVAEVEDKGDTAKQRYGSDLPQEVLTSGIGVGITSGTKTGAAAGVAGEEDERYKAEGTFAEKSEK